MILRVFTTRRSTSRLEAISNLGLYLIVFLALPVNAALSQSLFLGGDYTLGNRAAGMSAYVADPDYAHSVLLNPAKLGYAAYLYVAGDYEYFSRGTGELFLPVNSPDYLSNGILSAWDASLGLPIGPVGIGAAFQGFELAGWRTTIAAVGAGKQLPLGFAIGVTAKYLTVSKQTLMSSGFDRFNLKQITVDVGGMNRTTLADNTFFRAILSTGFVFTNLIPHGSWSPEYEVLGTPDNPGYIDVNLPRTFGCGVAYTFASNYRLADFELFRVTGALDYSHVFDNSYPIDSFTQQRDQYRLGLETIALGILAVRIGYTLKTPAVQITDPQNSLFIARAGTGFSYGFSLRFPVKLVLPSLPVASLEISYAKNPEWSSGMYHDLFGAVFEIVL
jgi:hypothetical protein